jgi:hypothetical protein
VNGNGWSDIDELLAHWTWVYYLTRKVAGSALLRRTVPTVDVTEDVDCKFQDQRFWERESRL